MPIVNGKYEAKISTTFSSPEEALKEIKEKLKSARTVRISNVPMSVLQPLLPLLQDKDVKIILPDGQKPPEQLKQLGRIAVQKSKIYKDHKGTQANVGSFYFSDRIFSLAWAGDKVLQADALDYSKCVKCMRTTFDTAWRYSKK